jgi:hypothetical protein
MTSLEQTLKNDLTDIAFKKVEDRLLLSFKDNDLMSKWRKILDSVQKRDIVERYSAENPELLTSFTKKNNTYRAGRHDYLTSDKNGVDCYIDGMCRGTRALVSNYSDKVCLGSYLAGLDSCSVDGAKIEHNRYKQEVFERYTSTLNWYKEYAIENAEDYQYTGENEYTLYESKKVLSKLSTLLKCTSGDGISGMPYSDVIIDKLADLRKSVGTGVASFTSSEKFKDFKVVLDDYILICANHKVDNKMAVKNKSILK